MNKHNNDGTEQSKKHGQQGGRRWIVATILVVAVGALGLAGATFANDGEGLAVMWNMHGHGMHGPMDPADMDKHIDGMVNHILADGTPEQKAKVSAIAKAALTDLRPLHVQMHAAHAQAVALLEQPTIDRSALEQLRAAQIGQLDAASKRIMVAIEDAADVLTPEQRVKLSEQLKKYHGMM